MRLIFLKVFLLCFVGVQFCAVTTANAAGDKKKIDKIIKDLKSGSPKRILANDRIFLIQYDWAMKKYPKFQREEKIKELVDVTMKQYNARTGRYLTVDSKYKILDIVKRTVTNPYMVKDFGGDCTYSVFVELKYDNIDTAPVYGVNDEKRIQRTVVELSLNKHYQFNYNPYDSQDGLSLVYNETKVFPTPTMSNSNNDRTKSTDTPSVVPPQPKMYEALPRNSE